MSSGEVIEWYHVKVQTIKKEMLSNSFLEIENSLIFRISIKGVSF
jgi:hypothetical protein